MDQEIERMAERVEGRSWPCPVCNRRQDLRLSKSGKPYMHCEDCLVQLFVRGPDGIRRMVQALEESTEASVPTREDASARRESGEEEGSRKTTENAADQLFGG